MHHRLGWGALIGALAVIAVLSVVVSSQARHGERLFLTSKQEGDEPVNFTATWKDQTNTTHTVATTQLAGESISACAARHQTAVAVLQEIYPPVSD